MYVHTATVDTNNIQIYSLPQKRYNTWKPEISGEKSSSSQPGGTLFGILFWASC